MAIGLLKAGVNANDVTASTALDVADTVNAIQLKVKAVEPVKTVVPVDFYDISALDSFDNLMFGVSAFDTNVVICINLDTHDKTNFGVPLPTTHIRNIKAFSKTFLIVEADGNTGFYKYYKTTNGGASWSLVLTQDISGVRMLTSKSMLLANVGGADVIFYAEYNINASRTPGSTNDRVRLMRSNDLGDTWSEVTRWNTDGTNTNVRHIHAVIQSPSGRIFLNTGDSNSESCMYSWDGVSAWPVNVNPADTVQTAGLKSISGSQQTRAIDFLFKDGALWFIPDLGSGQVNSHRQMGVWKINEDLDPSSFTLAYPVLTNIAGAAGWLGCTGGDGELVWLNGMTNPAAGAKFAPIVVGNKSWTKFSAVGAFRSLNSATDVIPYCMFSRDGKIYASCGSPSGKTPAATAVFSISENDFTGDTETRYRYETIHPVYFLDSVNGSDANNGFTPRTPWLSYHYGLQSSRMTYGARLQILNDSVNVITTAGNAIPNMSANARGGDPVESISISGSGASKTTITLDGSSTAALFHQMWGGSAQKIELQDLTIRNNRVDASIATSDETNGGAGAHSFGMIRCVVDVVDSSVRLARVLLSNNMESYAINCVFKFREQAVEMFDARTQGKASYTLDHCLLISGNSHMTFRGTNNYLYATNTEFVGAYQQTIRILSGTTFTSIKGVNCNFWTDAVSTSVALQDLASLTWSGQFLNGGGSQPRGVSLAFDAYSKISKSTIPLFNYSDYVY